MYKLENVVMEEHIFNLKFVPFLMSLQLMKSLISIELLIEGNNVLQLS